MGLTGVEQDAALEALARAVATLQKQVEPQTMRDALETTWNPRGHADELVLQDATGAPLTRRTVLQFIGAALADDPLERRSVVTVTTPTPPPASAGIAKHVDGNTYLSGGGPQGVPGLGITLDVADDGSGYGTVLYSYIVAWQAWGNATSKAVNTTWDFRIDGAQVFPPTSNSALAVRPQITLVSINDTRYIYTAPASEPSASAGADTITSGGLSLSAPLSAGNVSPHAQMPGGPILLRCPAGTHTLDVYWSNASAGSDEILINMGAAMALPLGV